MANKPLYVKGVQPGQTISSDGKNPLLNPRPKDPGCTLTVTFEIELSKTLTPGQFGELLKSFLESEDSLWVINRIRSMEVKNA